MLNLYQLQMFVMVADKGSFSAAAKELLVTQPAVSEQIRGLEQRLGVQLFDRRGHRMELTPEGAGMLDAARRLLELAGEIEQDYGVRREAIGGRLRIGCATSAAAPLLAALAGEFCRAHPQTSLKIDPLPQADLLDLLRDGQLDCGFSAAHVRGSSLDQAQVATDEWLFLAPADHPWRTGIVPRTGVLPTINAAHLRDQPLVVASAEDRLGYEARRELQGLLDERGVAWRDLRLSVELPDAGAVMAAVMAGAGVGIVSRTAIADADRACLFALDGGPLLRRLIMLRNRRLATSRAAQAWWDFVLARGAAD